MQLRLSLRPLLSYACTLGCSAGAAMIIDILSRFERDVVVRPQRGIHLLRIGAVLFALCALFIAAMLVGALTSMAGAGRSATLGDFNVFALLIICTLTMFASCPGIWRGSVNAMLVAWVAFALTLVSKAVTLTFSLGSYGQIDIAVLVLLVTGLIAMRALLARGFELSRLMKDGAPPSA